MLLLSHFRGDTKHMLTPYQRIPYRAIPALAWNALNKAIGIKNNHQNHSHPQHLAGGILFVFL